MKKTLSVLATVLIMAALFVGCAASSSLTGNTFIETYGSTVDTYVFGTDGTLTITSVTTVGGISSIISKTTASYSVNGDELSITQTKDNTTATTTYYVVYGQKDSAGNTVVLILQDNDVEMALTLVKK